jgi:hypothetical protein
MSKATDSGFVWPQQEPDFQWVGNDVELHTPLEPEPETEPDTSTDQGPTREDIPEHSDRPELWPPLDATVLRTSSTGGDVFHRPDGDGGAVCGQTGQRGFLEKTARNLLAFYEPCEVCYGGLPEREGTGEYYRVGVTDGGSYFHALVDGDARCNPNYDVDDVPLHAIDDGLEPCGNCWRETR